MRTLEQLRKRIEYARGRDPIGLAIHDLLVYDPKELKEGVEPDDLSKAKEECEKALREYMEFAFDKAINHRGLSANRSVLHFENWLWLMERDDLLPFVEDDNNYRSYGVPILKYVARAFDIPIPEEIANWKNGEPCSPDCEGGCSI